MARGITSVFVVKLCLVLTAPGQGTNEAAGRVAVTNSAEMVTSESTGFERAQALYNEGVVFEAIKEVDLYTLDHPDDEAAFLFKAKLLMEVNHDDRAALALTQVLRINPDNVEAANRLARIRNDLVRALDLDDREAVLRYARLCARPGSYDRAAHYYRLALAQEDNTAVQLELARMLSWAGEYSESIIHYEIVAERNPGNPQVLKEMGVVYNAMEKFDEAVDAYQVCVDTNPNDYAAQVALIQSMIWAGRGEEAGERLAVLRQQIGDEVDVVMLAAALSDLNGAILEAYDGYLRVLEMDPEHKEALRRVEELEQNHRVAIARIKQQIDYNPDSVELRLSLVDLYMEQQRIQDAIDTLEDINRMQPSNIKVADQLTALRRDETERVMNRVNAYREKRAVQQDSEISRMRNWLEENPADQRMRLLLARQLLAAGLEQEAQSELESLYMLAPLDPVVVEMLTKVNEKMMAQDSAKEAP